MPKPKPDFSGMEEEQEPIVVGKKNPLSDLMKELKSDPEFRQYLVPIPDYGAVNCLISMKILRELQDARKSKP